MKRLIMDIKLKKFHIENTSFNYRQVTSDDWQQIGELDFISVKDTIEYSGETVEDTTTDMKQTFEGKYGKLIPDASFVIKEKGKIVSATIFVLSKENNSPFLAFAMTHPQYQNKGMCQFLLKHSINSLIDQGFDTSFLAVKDGNDPAITVYKKLGFTMRYQEVKTTSDYKACYDNPLNLRIGDKIKLYQKDVPEKWHGWHWCKDSTGNEGWISESYFKKYNDSGEIIKDYTAQELTVKNDECLCIIFEDSGWCWCKKPNNEEGWLPTEILKTINND